MDREITSMTGMDFSCPRKSDDSELIIYNGDVITLRCLRIIEASKKKNFQPFRMLDLNWDCRVAVLKACIPVRKVGVFLPGNYFHRRVGLRLPILTRTNKQLRLESLYVTISQTTYSIHSGPGNASLQTWLDSVDLTGLHGDVPKEVRTVFDAVKRLDFPYFSRFPFWNANITQNNDVVLMLRCRNLVEVWLHWVPSTLRDANGLDKSAAQLRQDYYLDGLLRLKQLKTLHFVAPFPSATLRAVGDWFEDEFGKQKEAGLRMSSVAVEYPDKIQSDTSDP